MMPEICLLPERGVLEISGPERRDFLQGLISNDIKKCVPGKAIHTALLTPQGRYLYDFFLVDIGESFLLDGEAARLESLLKKLQMHKLRAKVDFKLRPELKVAAIWKDGASFDKGVVFTDPRHVDAGLRVIMEEDLPASVSHEEYLRHQIELALPDSSRDLEPEKALLLENGFDRMNSVDWQKGCYLGQEVTARTKYRGLIKHQLCKVLCEDPKAPVSGSPLYKDEKEVGIMRSSVPGLGLALLNVELAEGTWVVRNGKLFPA